MTAYLEPPESSERFEDLQSPELRSVPSEVQSEMPQKLKAKLHEFEKIEIAEFEDDGTLELLRFSCDHPNLKRVFDNLENHWIADLDLIREDFHSLPVKVAENETPDGCCPRRLLGRVRILTDEIGKAMIDLDCLDLSELEGSRKDAVRQSRKEILQILETISDRCDQIAKSSLRQRVEILPKIIRPPAPPTAPVGFISAPPSKPSRKSGFSDPLKSETKKSNFSGPRISNFSDPPPNSKNPSNKDAHSRRLPQSDKSTGAGRGRPAVPTPAPAPLDSRQKKPVGHGEFFESESDGENPRKKQKRKVDWEVRVKEKIEHFKLHTSQGGCVTALYDQPVSRDTLLSLLIKCEDNLSQAAPSATQMKVAIETFISALDCAFGYLQKLRVNKTQMRLLYQSATALDALRAPTDLIPEMRSLQGLLKTFGMF